MTQQMETDVAVTEKTLFSIGTFRNYIHELAEKATNSDVGWEEDLDEADVQFVKDLASIVQFALDEDTLAVQVLDSTDDGIRIKAALRHQHECGQRLTGPAVTVERT